MKIKNEFFKKSNERKFMFDGQVLIFKKGEQVHPNDESKIPKDFVNKWVESKH